MNALIAMIQTMEKSDAPNIPTPNQACARFGNLPQVKRHKPMMVDSTKKEIILSIASGTPATSPINRVNADQFIPN
ncbi:Uncharacterised protein [Mycobacteroides abscessus subsp. abscessus]|nr:Uncharacterised protein [Mycobacteroides abscessus subsp. abscessus]